MDHCKACETKAEHYRCPACGMTGREIAKARKESR